MQINLIDKQIISKDNGYVQGLTLESAINIIT